MPLRVRCIICCEYIECSRNDTAPLLDHIRLAHPNLVIISSNSSNQINKETPSKTLKKQSASILTIPKDNSDVEPEFYTPKKLDNKPVRTLSFSKIQNSSNLDIKNPEKKPQTNIHYLLEPDLGKKICISKIPKSLKQPRTNIKSLPKSVRKNRSKISNNLSEPKETQALYKRKYKVVRPLSCNRNGKRKLYKTSIERWRPGKSTIVCPECGANKRPLIKTHVDKVSHSPLGAACILTCWPFCFLPCLFPPPTKEYLHCSLCNHFLGIYDQKTEEIIPNQEYLKRNQYDSEIELNSK